MKYKLSFLLLKFKYFINHLVNRKEIKTIQETHSAVGIGVECMYIMNFITVEYM